MSTFAVAYNDYSRGNDALALSEFQQYKVQYALLGLDGVNPVLPGATESGFGGRITWNLNHRYSVEGEVDFFLSDRLERGRRTQALFGMKMSARIENAR